MPSITRREWLALTASSALFGQPSGGEPEARIAQVIRAYEEQGIHRTGTAVDRASAEWLMAQVAAAGLKPEHETFSLSRVDPVSVFVTDSARRADGIPLFDGAFTASDGIRGRVGPLGDAEIGLAEVAPNRAGVGELGRARRGAGHRAIVVITHGGRPGLCPSNADDFLHPFGPPVVQVSSEEKSWLDECARKRSELVVVAQVKRTPAEALNVTAGLTGVDAKLPPLLIMTPRSGWWTCASERGGGIACWLEAMRALVRGKPARDILFVASSGHEIGQRGIEVYAERRPGLIARARAWIHLGANIGAKQGAGNLIQASDEEMESTLANAMAAENLNIGRRALRGTVPGGEAGVIYRGKGRYMSIIGSNALFHNPADRGPQAVDIPTIAAFARTITAIARNLSSA